MHLPSVGFRLGRLCRSLAGWFLHASLLFHINVVLLLKLLSGNWQQGCSPLLEPRRRSLKEPAAVEHALMCDSEPSPRVQTGKTDRAHLGFLAAHRHVSD